MTRPKKKVPKLSKPKPKAPKVGTTKAGAEQRKKDFVNMFFIYNQNATRAAIECGYPPNSAGVQGHLLLKDQYVKAAIQQRRDQISARIALTAEEVMMSLARAVRFDPGKLYNADGSFKKIHEIDDDTRLELVGADVDQIISGRGTNRAIVSTAKVKYANKQAARDQAMKHFRLFPSEKEIGEDDAAPAPVAITIEFKDARRSK